MTDNDLPSLADFKGIRENLDTERKTLIKVNSFAENDDYVRSNEDAAIVLEFVEKVQSNLYELFKHHPSLSTLFNLEFGSLFDFFRRENVVELIFLADCLFPEKELYFFGQDGGLNPAVLELHIGVLNKWAEGKKTKHEENQKLIKENFNLEIKMQEMECQCVACHSDYRTRVREFVYDEAISLIEKTKEEIQQNIDKGITEVSLIFHNMQRTLDRKFQQVQYRLKRSSLNRLEAQVKSQIEEHFHYPSELAIRHGHHLIPYLQGLLASGGMNVDLISDDEYKRFFKQLSSQIWRNEKFIEREFSKFTKSVFVLKRKDISSNILQEYLGQFWVHAKARKIPRKIVYHMGPTNSGKTYHAIEALSKSKKGTYLAPLRLLAAELYDTLNQKGVKTTLLTGEEVIELEDATHYSSTIEMAKLHEQFDCAVIDEIQMITDRQRGWAWTRALVSLQSHEVHVCGDGSVAELIKQIADLCGDELEIRTYERKTKLLVENQPISLASLQRHDALIVFSRRNALKYKYDLEQLGFKVSIVYGMLSPEVRREQARKFDQGITDVIVSTDAISMGMNLPIKRIVFSTLTKHIDGQEHPITTSEIKQIAGRAGRFQRFPLGHVTCLTKCEEGIEEINRALDTVLEQQTQAMVGPDLEIYSQVNTALKQNGLQELRLSEFLRLFNTMTFTKPFFCVDLKEMIELAEMVEDADTENVLSSGEIFGFSCAPVNLGLVDHVQYFMWILKKYVAASAIKNELINHQSNEIDYLETSIKCVELFQWLSRHFNGKNFEFDEVELLKNKMLAIEKLNVLLSDKITPTCSSCGCKLPDKSKFAICEECFKSRRFVRQRSFEAKIDGEISPMEQIGQRRGGGFNRNRPGKRPPGKSGGAHPQRSGKPGEDRSKIKISKKRKFSGKRK